MSSYASVHRHRGTIARCTRLQSELRVALATLDSLRRVLLCVLLVEKSPPTPDDGGGGGGALDLDAFDDDDDCHAGGHRTSVGASRDDDGDGVDPQLLVSDGYPA